MSKDNIKHHRTLLLLQREVVKAKTIGTGNGRLEKQYEVSFHHSTLPLDVFIPKVGSVDAWARRYLILANRQIYMEWMAAWLPSSEVATELLERFEAEDTDWCDLMDEVLARLFDVGPQDANI
ncbi:hypothetical protein CERZMDRAFT_91934 [Cercospora zeae-maydis SCOH1-5]|uniref:Uncharacterized protein n=1 Tax=Cercospora zeae-maydis SCOH1-5 TaxID=717836 RepID=A0A6A6EYY6_9PEZI|nr:hypothetical protein CERZMDRAFT_91934 [Cercospora zeae-maydis SCOH1-5]